MKIPSHYIAPPEAAKLLGVSKATIHRWINKGVLPAKRFGLGRHMIDRADVERLAQGQDVQAKGAAE